MHLYAYVFKLDVYFHANAFKLFNHEKFDVMNLASLKCGVEKNFTLKLLAGGYLVAL
jgi:hypothetical protein